MAHVLIVEPDHQLAKTVKKYLIAKGHTVSWRPDPQGAVNSADRNRPHVIILDLSLGSHNGVEFLYEFRSYPEWLTIPIIIYTNLSKHELAGLEDSLSELTVSAYLYKPKTSMAELTDSVQRLASAVPA
jgi:two-component system, OmpR family, response regulator